MSTVLWVIFIVVILVAVTIPRKGHEEDSQRMEVEKVIPPVRNTHTYRKRTSIMNRSEMAFFYELQRQIPREYYIFPNMRIADIIDAIEGDGFHNRRNKILPKHIDFLICNSYFKPMLAIEVNGGSHLRPDRIQRDKLVKTIFEDAELPLEFVNVGTSFVDSIAHIRTILDAELKGI